MVRVVYFAWVREAIGCDGEDVAVEGLATVGDLAAALAMRGGGYAAVFNDLTRLRAAVDQVMVPFDTPIADAAEIAFFPPVTGG